ncbi:MAG: PEGA domain-containing protein [Kiritimatiellae bacterium]|nr:PEGA domain-containing protein [Kiritimatiellia bacterium]
MRRVAAFLTVWSVVLFSVLGAADREPSTTLEVTSQPNGVTVWVDHVNRGVTPLTLTDLPAGPHLLRYTMDGYDDVFETVQVTQGAMSRASQNLRRTKGLLLLLTDPKGCEVSENGVSLGVTPLMITTLPVGTHRLQISSAGYQTKLLEVKLEGRTPLRQEVTLMSDSGTINLTSDPVGAEVYVNGILRGKSPCKIDRIPGGQVTLELKADGFQPHSREISMAAGEVQAVDIRLQPLPGTLRIVTIPDGARVYVDNEFRGNAPYDWVNVKPGQYRVRVDMAGHESAARNVTVEQGASATEEFRLVRNTGRIELITAPAGAMVLVDGEKRGLTSTTKRDTTAVSDPYAMDDVLEGEHEITVFRKGYAQQKRKVTVVRGETLTLQFKLIRQFIPDYEVTTIRSYYKGVLEFKNDEGIRIEISPGVSQTIPMKDVKKHGYIREEN